MSRFFISQYFIFIFFTPPFFWGIDKKYIFNILNRPNNLKGFSNKLYIYFVMTLQIIRFTPGNYKN